MSRLSKWLERWFRPRRPPTHPVPPLPPPDPTIPPGQVDQEMLDRFNSVRSRRLTLDAELQAFAQKTADHCVAIGHQEHRPLRPLAMKRLCEVGEIIAPGRNSLQAFSRWQQSPDHWESIRDPTFTVVGIGRAGIYWVAVFAER